MITELSRASLRWGKRVVSGVLRREGRRTQERPRPNRRPLCVEALEDRLVLDGGTGLQSSVSVADAFKIGVEAYTYAYPLVAFGQTQLVATNVDKASTQHAPLNQFTYGAIQDQNETDIVLPNVNVLYNNAFLNLQPEPMVLHIPNTNGRYYIQEILDAWTNVDFDPGSRTNWSPGDYLLTGPNWSGTVPPGITQKLAMPTNLAWILGRTFTTGDPNDEQIAMGIQKQFTLTPLSAYGTPYTPPTNLFVNPALNTQPPPLNQVSNMSAGTFFGMLTTLWMSNPPQSADGPILADLAKVGLVPGQAYDLSKQPTQIQVSLEAAARAALKFIQSDQALALVRGRPLNGWSLTTSFDGQWDTEYLNRAVVAYRGIGINAAQDAVYAYGQSDNTGLPLNGGQSYTITFPANTPPVNLGTPTNQQGFWSVTLYNSDGTLAFNTYNNLGSTQINAGTWKANADGSHTVVIQQNQPADTSNWLQAPAGDFVLLLRMYSPEPQVYDKTDPHLSAPCRRPGRAARVCQCHAGGHERDGGGPGLFDFPGIHRRLPRRGRRPSRAVHGCAGPPARCGRLQRLAASRGPRRQSCPVGRKLPDLGRSQQKLARRLLPAVPRPAARRGGRSGLAGKPGHGGRFRCRRRPGDARVRRVLRPSAGGLTLLLSRTHRFASEELATRPSRATSPAATNASLAAPPWPTCAGAYRPLPPSTWRARPSPRSARSTASRSRSCAPSPTPPTSPPATISRASSRP
jgi:DNA sulfur modification protein DndE